MAIGSHARCGQCGSALQQRPRGLAGQHLAGEQPVGQRIEPVALAAPDALGDEVGGGARDQVAGAATAARVGAFGEARYGGGLMACHSGARPVPFAATVSSTGTA